MIAGVLSVETHKKVRKAQFDQEELHRPRIQGNDALVITALLANYEIKRVFIDSGSSTDILFGEAYDQMQLGGAPLEAVDTFLYGFAGEVVHPKGMVSLPLTLGTTPLRKTCLLKFLVVDISSAYHIILGRPTLDTFQAVISTYHMKIKFPMIGGVGEAQANALQARKCYIEAIKKGKKRGTEEPPETKDSNKQENDPIHIPEPDEENPVVVQPVEELLTIELALGDSGKDLEGIDPSVCTHHLNLDPSAKPVKQKKRHFGLEKDKIIRGEVNKLLPAENIKEIEFPE
ncbi:hypothetical protein Sango_2369200 [Sesamum angolense]|uniref:Uncharacterized protein n=1 Tax=Sesamum angolense TaxID=2727404 RepID=A0AAE1W6G2_9LAMI|nr:hypothetical protein Sango_2369200 [Sesamum angolense]